MRIFNIFENFSLGGSIGGTIGKEAAERAAKELAEKAAIKAAREAAEKAAREAAEKAAREAAEKTAKEAAEKAAIDNSINEGYKNDLIKHIENQTNQTNINITNITKQKNETIEELINANQVFLYNEKNFPFDYAKKQTDLQNIQNIQNKLRELNLEFMENAINLKYYTNTNKFINKMNWSHNKEIKDIDVVKIKEMNNLYYEQINKIEDNIPLQNSAQQNLANAKAEYLNFRDNYPLNEIKAPGGVQKYQSELDTAWTKVENANIELENINEQILNEARILGKNSAKIDLLKDGWYVKGEPAEVIAKKDLAVSDAVDAITNSQIKIEKEISKAEYTAYKTGELNVTDPQPVIDSKLNEFKKNAEQNEQAAGGMNMETVALVGIGGIVAFMFLYNKSPQEASNELSKIPAEELVESESDPNQELLQLEIIKELALLQDANPTGQDPNSTTTQKSTTTPKSTTTQKNNLPIIEIGIGLFILFILILIIKNYI
jgi:hypothetical protein